MSEARHKCLISSQDQKNVVGCCLATLSLTVAGSDQSRNSRADRSNPHYCILDTMFNGMDFIIFYFFFSQYIYNEQIFTLS